MRTITNTFNLISHSQAEMLRDLDATPGKLRTGRVQARGRLLRVRLRLRGPVRRARRAARTLSTDAAGHPRLRRQHRSQRGLRAVRRDANRGGGWVKYMWKNNEGPEFLKIAYHQDQEIRQGVLRRRRLQPSQFPLGECSGLSTLLRRGKRRVDRRASVGGDPVGADDTASRRC